MNSKNLQFILPVFIVLCFSIFFVEWKKNPFVLRNKNQKILKKLISFIDDHIEINSNGKREVQFLLPKSIERELPDTLKVQFTKSTITSIRPMEYHAQQYS